MLSLDMSMVMKGTDLETGDMGDLSAVQCGRNRQSCDVPFSVKSFFSIIRSVLHWNVPGELSGTHCIFFQVFCLL